MIFFCDMYVIEAALRASVQCFEISIVNVLKRKNTKHFSLVKNLPIFTNRNERNLVLSCPCPQQ